MHLQKARAGVRFLSIEPLIAPVGKLYLANIHWVIVGGESGPGARPMKPEWAIDIRDQCVAARVPFFFKQWGGRSPKTGGRKLEGKVWSQFPRELRRLAARIPSRRVTAPPPLKFDEIGDWSELKLEIVEKYGAAYAEDSGQSDGSEKILYRCIQRRWRPCLEGHGRDSGRQPRPCPRLSRRSTISILST